MGAAGINFHLPEAQAPIATVDLDIFVKPDAAVLSRALEALAKKGFSFFVGDEPFLDAADTLVLENIVRLGGSVRAERDGAFLDLMTSMAGYGFTAIARDASEFRVGAGRIRVGKLEKLLRSKKLVGRARDKEFLRAFKARK